MTHGTTHQYNKGCRCELCRAAKSEANKKRRDAMLKREKPAKVNVNFELVLSVLMMIKRLSSVSSGTLLECYAMPTRTMNTILCDLMQQGFIESSFVMTGFREGYYVYSVSEKTIDILK